MENDENKRIEQLKREWEQLEEDAKQLEQMAQENLEFDQKRYGDPSTYSVETGRLIERAAAAKETALEAELTYQLALEQQEEQQTAVAGEPAAHDAQHTVQDTSTSTEEHAPTREQTAPKQEEKQTAHIPEEITTLPRLASEHIPQTVMLRTLEQIVCGYTRIEVARQLLEQENMPDWLQPLKDMDKTAAANLLSQRLRQADPNSNKFAYTKYQDHLKRARELAQQHLKTRLEELITNAIDTYQQLQTELEERIADVKIDIDENSVDPTDKRQMIKLYSKLLKQRDDREINFLSQLHSLLHS